MRLGDPIATLYVGHKLDGSLAGSGEKAMCIGRKHGGPDVLAGRAFLAKERATA